MKMDNVNHIGIVGTGMIATSLAVLTSGHGYRTTLYAMNDELAEESKGRFDRFYEQMLEQELLTREQMEICKRYAGYTTSYDDLADADVIFECVIEKAEIKHEVYHTLEEKCPDLKAIISVSSALEVDQLNEGCGKYKSKIMVAHPFNPPHMVPYFELVGGTDTDPDVISFGKKLLEALDRKPVVLKKSAPGFIGNRLQFALWREALNIVDSGIAEPEDVDTCLMYSFCPRYTSIGIFEHFDNGGLTLNYSTCENVFPTLSNATGAPSVKKLLDEGHQGRPTGKGFYDWSNVDLVEFGNRVSAPYWRLFDWEFPKE